MSRANALRASRSYQSFLRSINFESPSTPNPLSIAIAINWFGESVSFDFDESTMCGARFGSKSPTLITSGSTIVACSVMAIFLHLQITGVAGLRGCSVPTEFLNLFVELHEHGMAVER